MKEHPKVLVISGSVGAGKSSTAQAISQKLSKQNIRHAVIDMDYLVYSFPRPEDDYSHRQLARKNLAALASNYKEIGVGYFVIPNVVENEEDVESIKAAIPGSELFVVRLQADLDVVHARLHARESGDSLKWHLNRAAELTERLENAKIENLVINTNSKTVNDVADEVIAKWLNAA